MMRTDETGTFRLRPGRRMVLFWLLSFPSWLGAQQLFFDQFSVSEGLAQSTVFHVIQDRNDLLWIGTNAGVSRFDGVEFINYSVVDGLSENGVRAICEDTLGQIWFGHSDGGVSRFTGEQFEAIREHGPLLESDITSIVSDPDGHLWFTTNGSGVVEVINPQAAPEELEINHYSGRELSDRVFGGYIDRGGNLYFVADPNVKVYNRENIQFDNVLFNGIPQYYATTCILIDGEGRIWFGKYNGGLYRYDPEKDTAEMFDLIKAGLASNWVSTLFEDKWGRVWAGTWGGGMIRISREGKMELFTNENGLPGMKIRTIMQDREENILVGTQENGLCVYKGDHFVSYFEDDGLTGAQVWAILEARSGEYWFGTNEGISILDDADGEGRFRDFEKLRGSRVRFLKEDMDGTVWIGTQQQGVFSYSEQGRYTFDPLINNNIFNLQVTAMEIDGENNLWVGTLDGLIYYEIDQGKVARLTQVNGLRGNDISSVFADSQDRIWVGSSGEGLTMIRADSLKQLDIGFDFTPRCFTEDGKGRIWIGTEGRGVIVYHPDSARVVRMISEEDGLLANLINQLSCDRYQNVYIGTNKGLNTFVVEEGKIYAYTASSGFVGIETKSGASLVDGNGNIWFGTVLGVTRYMPDERSRARKEPLTHIIGLEVNHTSYPLRNGLSLSHAENSLIFEYRCITLNPDEVRYQIKLEGVDQEWRRSDTQTRVTYPALRHGKYRFLVRAKSSEGVWNEEPVTFSFEIRPPFWLTWYFIVAVIFAVGLIIFSYIKIRERALRKENAILEEKVRDRTATVVAQKEELAQKNKDITDSIRYAKRIQFAILPDRSPFPETFILFKPKDIVSGDFYWFTQVDGREFLAAVDCTGHGVPGAFMSIIGHNSLSKIVREYGMLRPGEILTQLNREVVETLHQRSDSKDVYDGMDLALICYQPSGRILEYAGAFNPLYLVRDGRILETKADKVSIGRSAIRTEVEFTNHTLEVRPGDTIYVFSDGYADQFGGELMKKFKYKNMKELLLKIQPLSMTRQRAVLDQTIEEWMGDVEQLDDILVVGRRF